MNSNDKLAEAIREKIAIETELMNQADKHGRIFNAQGAPASNDAAGALDAR